MGDFLLRMDQVQIQREYERIVEGCKQTGPSYEQATAIGLMYRQILGALTPDMRIAIAMAVDNFQERPEFATEPDPPILNTYKELAGFEVVKMATSNNPTERN